MSKAVRTLGFGSVLLAVWLAVLLDWLPLPLNATVRNEVWPVLPLEALIGLGAYMLGSVGYGLMTFRDCPEAYHELVQEIDMAKSDLMRHKVI
ncbi:hypothetical protein H4R35_002576 [Dimargaris xerosporica]|nr:hypothetical protein H4R35_002576 [Dimargaris xerosporica]